MRRNNGIKCISGQQGIGKTESIQMLIRKEQLAKKLGAKILVYNPFHEN